MLDSVDVNVDAFINLLEDEEKKEAVENSNQQGIEIPPTCELKNKAIVRFVNGIPETEFDVSSPESGRAKILNINTFLKDDDGKYFNLILPGIVNNKPLFPHTMIDFVKKVLSKAWVEGTNGAKGHYEYYYANRNDYGQQSSGFKTLAQIFEYVHKSGVSKDSQYYTGAKNLLGQTVYIANVIDRLDYDWHRQNKSTKLLARSLKVRKNGNVSRKELSQFSVETPFKELIESSGPKLNYDVLIVPPKENLEKCIMKNVSKLKQINYWDEVRAYITEEDKQKISIESDFTAEEKMWDTINIEKYYKISSAKYILKHLGKTIQSFDMAVGTDFYERFKAEAEADAKIEKTSHSASLQSNASPATQQTVNNPTLATGAQSNLQINQQPITQQAPQQAPQQMQQQAYRSNNLDSFDTQTGEPSSITPSQAAQDDIEKFYADL